MNLSELIPELPKTAASILLVDFLRYFVAAGLVYWRVWRVFARQLQGRCMMPNPPKPGQMWREFRHSMSTVCIFGFSGVCIYTTGLATLQQCQLPCGQQLALKYGGTGSHYIHLQQRALFKHPGPSQSR